LQDLAEGIRWYERAAQSGHAPAQYQLAMCYDLGAGVPESDAARSRVHARAQ
jgi:TPR repeat protein